MCSGSRQCWATVCTMNAASPCRSPKPRCRKVSQPINAIAPATTASCTTLTR
jgi:hypothetical protein